MSAKAKDKVVVTAKEEVERVRALGLEAAKSGAYLYPLKGIFYFISHHDLWKPLVRKLVPTLGLAAAITVGMFVFTYLPQMALMTFTEGPLAPFNAALLVLSESSTLFNVLSKRFLIEDALLDTFDGTLVSKGMTTLVSQGREVKSGSAAVGKLGKLIKSPFQKYSPTAIIKYLMYLPLNLIPGVGTLIFVILQGKSFGPVAHQRYFQLKGWSSRQREEFIEQHRGAYTSFGIPAALLETLPIAQVLFAFTNAVGAGLWAADIEKGRTTAPDLRGQAEKAQ